MKFPEFLRTFAVIQLIAVFVYGATGVISLFAISKGASAGVLTALPVISALTTNACWILMLVSAIFWIRRSAASFAFVFANSIITTAAFILIIAVTLSSSEGSLSSNILFIAFFSIVPAFSWVLFFRARHFYSADNENNVSFINSSTLTFLSVLLALGAVAFIWMKTGTITIIMPIENTIEGKDIPSKTIDRVYDDSELTWWTPSNKTGIDSFVTAETRNPGYISGVLISGGAHFPETIKGPLTNKSYSRPEKISIELSNGQKYRFTCKNTPDVQKFTFPAGIAHWVRITFLSSYKGEKWDELCISEIGVLGTRSFFKK
jgi:hypothetical protein